MHSTHDLRWNRLPVWFHGSDAQESDSTHWRETIKLLELLYSKIKSVMDVFIGYKMIKWIFFEVYIKLFSLTEINLK